MKIARSTPNHFIPFLLRLRLGGLGACPQEELESERTAENLGGKPGLLKMLMHTVAFSILVSLRHGPNCVPGFVVPKARCQPQGGAT